MTRSAAIGVLDSVVAAPVTRTVRSMPTELPLGPEDGMSEVCAAIFDNLRVVPKAYLIGRVCVLDPIRMIDACAALRAAVDC